MSLSLRKAMAAGLLAVLVAAAALLPATIALANGVPVDVYLSYLPDVSNWGPQSATGKSVVAVADGYVDLNVQGLTQLKGEQYAVWLESKADRKMWFVGNFNVDAQGAAHFHASIEAFPYQEYRMLLLTVQPEPDPNPAPSNKHSLAGIFPVKAVVQVTPGAPASAGSGSGAAGLPAATPAGPRPSYLPVTGARTGYQGWVWALAVVPLGAAAYFLLRQRRHE